VLDGAGAILHSGRLQPRDTAAWTLLVLVLNENVPDWSKPDSHTLQQVINNLAIVTASKDLQDHSASAVALCSAITGARKPLVDAILSSYQHMLQAQKSCIDEKLVKMSHDELATGTLLLCLLNCHPLKRGLVFQVWSGHHSNENSVCAVGNSGLTENEQLYLDSLDNARSLICHITMDQATAIRGRSDILHVLSENMPDLQESQGLCMLMPASQTKACPLQLLKCLNVFLEHGFHACCC
jgi:hypothetical protein